MVSADNLGSLLLGGFKESCTSYRMCRHCMATKQDSETMVSLKYNNSHAVMYYLQFAVYGERFPTTR